MIWAKEKVPKRGWSNLGERVILGSWGKGFGTLGKWEKNYLWGSQSGVRFWRWIRRSNRWDSGGGGGVSNQVRLTMVGLVNDKVQIIGVRNFDCQNTSQTTLYIICCYYLVFAVHLCLTWLQNTKWVNMKYMLGFVFGLS